MDIGYRGRLRCSPGVCAAVPLYLAGPGIPKIWLQACNTRANMAIPSPTDAERVALKRIASVRVGLVFPLLASLAAILIAMRFDNGVASILLSAFAALTTLGLVGYASFG